MKKMGLLLFSGLFILGITSSLTAEESHPAAPASAKDFLGEKIASVMTNPERILSYRVQLPESNYTGDKLGYAAILSKGPELPPDQTQELSALALDDKSYDFTSEKLCAFNPVVGFKFIKGGEEVVLLVCFRCNEWEFEYNDQGKREDFDAVKPKLLAIAKSLFPNDEELHALK